jgi:glycosyltransferase involved in cell wall biosynthesis
VTAPAPGDPPAILQVLPALTAGGVERGTLEIAEAIGAAGLRAWVASAGGALVPALERLGARHVTLPLARKDPLSLWRNAARLEALIRQEGIRIVHARSRAPAWSAWLATRHMPARLVTTYHGTYNEGWPGKRLYNSVMARGERVIAISDFIADHLRARHGTSPDRILVIPRGVDPALFDPDGVAPRRVDALRQAWSLPVAGPPVIMLPGRLTRWKGGAVLIEAAAKLRRRCMVVLAGGAEPGREGFRTELELLAAARGLEGSVRLVGHVADMPAALLLADVVVHASTDPEAFGRTVIEAQAMRRPVIASDLGATRETVQEAVTGWRVPAGDPDALAQAIDWVLGLPPEEREAIGRRAREAVLARYTTARMQAATIAVYRELLA